MKKGKSIAITQSFSKAQPRVFGVDPAELSLLSFGKQKSSVQEGFSCNVHRISITPHCNGTHTEGVGHISEVALPLPKSIAETFLSAQLISVEAKPAANSADSYSVSFAKEDLVIDLEDLRAIEFLERDALIIRTLPNDLSKSFRDYEVDTPPFFTIEAMEHIRSLGFNHLLVDFPSLDRLDDNGHLACHRIFFGLPRGSSSPSPASLERSVTEMIFVSDDIQDGEYLLQIQTPAFELEAVPSNPVLFPISYKDFLSD